MPSPKARTTVSCARSQNPSSASLEASQSVHACSPHTSAVRSLSSSDPHSRHTRIADITERLCTSYTRPNPSVSRES